MCLPGLVHSLVSKSDAAFRQAVYEAKVVKDLELPGASNWAFFLAGRESAPMSS